MKIVAALGGNALARENQRGTYEEMVRNVRVVCNQLMKIIDTGHQLVLTHGNGPQVGNLALQQTSTKDVPELPLHVLDSMTQGEIGYVLQRELGNSLRSVGSRRQVVSLVTQVVVDPDDPAFSKPSKPIGPFYDKETAMKIQAERGFVMSKAGPGSKTFRRVVASPQPQSIVEADLVSKMLTAGAIAIAGGGGGVPVVKISSGQLVGVDAVVDKDLSSEKLAEGIRADVLMILTGVDAVSRGFGTRRQEEIRTMTVSEAKKLMKSGEFPQGSMMPKVEACVRFVEWGGKPAMITSIRRALECLNGRAGTKVIPG